MRLKKETKERRSKLTRVVYQSSEEAGQGFFFSNSLILNIPICCYCICFKEKVLADLKLLNTSPVF